jgi:hypothetical protein
MMKKGIIYLLLFVCFKANCQWERVDLKEFSDKILASEKKLLENQNYRFSGSYKFFNSIESNEAVLEYPAKIMVLKGKTFHIEQFNQLALQNNELNVVVDTTLKTITVQAPIESFVKRRTSDDFKPFLSGNCIVMKALVGSITKYSIEFAEQSRFKGCDVWFDGNDQLIKYVLYGSQVVLDDTDFFNPQEIQPKLEISYSDFQQGKDTDLTGFNYVEDFLLITDKEIKLLPAYSAYELIDLRVY